MLAKEYMFSPISSGELLQVFEQGGWLGSYLYFKNVVLTAKRRKMAMGKRGGRETNHGAVVF